MKSMSVRKTLVVTLAATMLMSSAITAYAADGSGGSETGSKKTESTGSSTAVITEAVAVPGEDNTPTVAFNDVVAANASMSVGDSRVVTTIAGAYASKNVNGMAVITPLSEIRTNLGLAADQTPYLMAFDTDAKKSSLAMASLNAAAESLGAKVITTLNIELGAKQSGKFVTLSNGSVNMVVGLPKAAIDPARTYSVICVRPGGAITILEDQDANPNTVTFAVKAGLGTYAITAK